MSKILVTGGAGFIGSNFIRRILVSRKSDYVVNVDTLSYAGNRQTISDFEQYATYAFYPVDIRDTAALLPIFASHTIDIVVHFAAESHVDRSIENAAAFVTTNVVGTQVLLDVARQHNVRRFIHISTDEVYGALGPTGHFTESTPLSPNSPYSASKAASDLLVRAAVRTHEFPAIITRCSNNYGPFQFPEKLIPLIISRAMQDLPLPVYGSGQNVRDWVYVDDHCRAIELVMDGGRLGEVYNIGGGTEKTNLDVVHTILDRLGKPHSLISMVPDRKGHDFRYAIDDSKLKNELGYFPKTPFDVGISQTIEWYQRHSDWIKSVCHA